MDIQLERIQEKMRRDIRDWVQVVLSIVEGGVESRTAAGQAVECGEGFILTWKT